MPNNFFLSWSQFFFPSYPQDSSNYFRFPAWLNFLFLNAASQETSPYLWHTRWIFFLSNGTTDDSKANLIIIPTRDDLESRGKGEERGWHDSTGARKLGQRRGGGGSAMANIIINQRRSDVNVKLPEPIWSCITRRGEGAEGGDTTRKGCKLEGVRAVESEMAHCESYLSCCLRIYGVRRIRAASFLLADYRWL